MGRRHYVPMKRHHDISVRRREDLPLTCFRDVPLKRCWVFHLRHTCDVTETYRETSLRRRHDVLLLGGLFHFHYASNWKLKGLQIYWVMLIINLQRLRFENGMLSMIKITQTMVKKIKVVQSLNLEQKLLNQVFMIILMHIFF